ncbi:MULTISPECIES: pentapeptide repeat-containing protein [Gordonia]|uniref:pentapeptide repeat-containing protein n=1 Tax=Gordonia TaxID=2053 RepID=UPI00027DE6D5|nr:MULTISPECIES: pentapeptide repeat-containing protein [Gordonia]AFR51579.1 hypothetical protein KTR9_5366 [Gordonia sp. KTR9]
MTAAAPATDAERQLIDAVSVGGGTVDLRTRKERSRRELPSPDDGAAWGDDRTVRAEFLQHLLLTLGTPVNLYGARIAGDLDLRGASLPPINLSRCIVDGPSRFNGATFPVDVWFEGTTFLSYAAFNSATFTGNAGFYNATFTGDAGFSSATFTDDVSFSGATFTGHAWFDGATFINHAGFAGATFTSAASFESATFTGNVARFDRATFTGGAGFGGTTFTGDAGFIKAIFTSDAKFTEATFTGGAHFTDAVFVQGADMSRCSFRRLELIRTVWSGSLVTVGLVAGRADLSEAVFDVPARVELVAAHVFGSRLQANHRFHLILAAGRLDLTDADLAAGSLIESMELPTTVDRFVSVPPLFEENGRLAKRSSVMPLNEFLEITLERYRLAADLTDLFADRELAAVVSLKRAHVAGVRLSGMDLTQCVFQWADGLDGLLISDTCVLQESTDADPGWRFPRLRRLRATRRVIYDEVVERRRARGVQLDPAIPDEANPRATEVPIPTEASVAMTYRSLRKALEDSKDEPGAADFYYGEMEMRRSSARLIDRFLLTLYWLTSGYGLRAWRALTSLAVVIAVAGWCFTNSDWVRISPTGPGSPVLSPTSDAWPWLFAGQETIALFRPAGTIGVTLVGFGAVVDIAVRVLGPVLLALAVLAIRNRTKR